MDPVTVGAVLLAVLTGVSEAAGGQLWAGVVALVRRPLRSKPAVGGREVSSGEAELTALQQTPASQDQAVALARVSAGLPLRTDMLRSASSVVIGQTVKLIAVGSDFSVSAEGSVMNNAAPGQQVQVIAIALQFVPVGGHVRSLPEKA